MACDSIFTANLDRSLILLRWPQAICTRATLVR